MPLDLRVIELLTIFFYFILKNLLWHFSATGKRKRKAVCILWIKIKESQGKLSFLRMSFFKLCVEKPHEKIYEYALAEKPLWPSVMPIREERLTCFTKTVCVFIARVWEKMNAGDGPKQKPKFIPVNVEKMIWTLFPQWRKKNLIRNGSRPPRMKRGYWKDLRRGKN